MRDRSSPCKVAGTSTMSPAAVHTQRSSSRTNTLRPSRPRTISSTNSGLPPARATIKSCSWPNELPVTGPNKPSTSARVSATESGASRMMDWPARFRSGIWVSGRCVTSIIRRRSAKWSARSRNRSTDAASAQCRSSTTNSTGSCCRRRSNSVRAASAICRLSCSGWRSCGTRFFQAQHVT